MLNAWKQKQLLEQTFAAYSLALVERDYETAYGFCSSDLQKVLTKDEFVTQYRQLEISLGPLRTIEQGQMTVNGNGSDWTAVVHTGDGA